MLFVPRNKKSPFAPLQVHHFCNRAGKVWGKCISASLCLKHQHSKASQIQLFVRQRLVLLPNIDITMKDSAFSVFKTAHRKYLSPEALRCLSLSAKAQHGNFVIYFFTSFIPYLLSLNPLSLSLKNTFFFFFCFVEYLQRMRNILHFSVLVIQPLHLLLAETPQLLFAALSSLSFPCGSLVLRGAEADGMSCSVFYSFLCAC